MTTDLTQKAQNGVVVVDVSTSPGPFSYVKVM